MRISRENSSENSSIFYSSVKPFLYVISEPVISPVTLCHAMDQMKQIANFIEHTLMILAMLYRCQDRYILRKNFGDWIERSGWTKFYEYSKINTSGKVDSFFNFYEISSIKRSHYCISSISVPLKVHEKIRLTSSSALFNTIYNNISYLMLFAKKKLRSFEISVE